RAGDGPGLVGSAVVLVKPVMGGPPVRRRSCSQLVHLEVAVVGGQRGHLPEPDPAGPQRSSGGGVVVPAQQGELVDGEGHVRAVLGDGDPVVTVGVLGPGQRVGALGDQVEAGALAQVAGVEAAFGGPLAAQVGDVQGGDVSGVVLR